MQITRFSNQYMEQIQHKHVEIRGLQIHVAEVGTGSVAVVFLHGFPEIWYSWRHQMLAVANAGYRALAPDWRGYGLSQHPPQDQWKDASFEDLQQDLLAILDTFNIAKAFLVAKDFGAVPAYNTAVVHPERILGIVALGVPFLPKLISREAFPEGFYIIRFGVPGRAEADFGRFDAKTVVKKIYIMFTWSELQVAGKDEEILDLVDASAPLPSWFTEEDLSTYAALYEKSGFHYALNLTYRSLSRIPNIGDNPKVEVPVLLLMGDKDYILKFPSMEDYIKNGQLEELIPDLDIKFLPEGNHFVQEQFPDKINELLFDFIKKHV